MEVSDKIIRSPSFPPNHHRKFESLSVTSIPSRADIKSVSPRGPYSQPCSALLIDSCCSVQYCAFFWSFIPTLHSHICDRTVSNPRIQLSPCTSAKSWPVVDTTRSPVARRLLSHSRIQHFAPPHSRLPSLVYPHRRTSHGAQVEDCPRKPSERMLFSFFDTNQYTRLATTGCPLRSRDGAVVLQSM